MDNNTNYFKTDQVDSGNTILPIAPDLSPVDNSRLSQQYVRPSAVKSSGLGPIVASSASGVGNGLAATATIAGSGNNQIFNFTVADKKGRTILALPDVSVYINSITTANQWPTSSYGVATLPVTVMNDWGLTDNINTVTRVVVRNNNVASVFVIVVCRWRVITNPTVQLAQADVGNGNLQTTASSLVGGSGGGA